MIKAAVASPHPPARYALAMRPGEDESHGEAPASPRILIVEDDYFIANELEHGLREAGYDVVGVAVTATEAVDLAVQLKPDIAIVDIRLARNSDGIATAVSLRETCNVRSIFATAHADPETRRRAEKAEPLGWVTKPYTADLVIAVIRSALSR
jgi:two-component system, response regulator PdtaR